MKVDFYVLENAASKQQSWHVACGILETIYANRQPIYVHAASKDDAERLDALLWTYRDDSFLPHLLLNQTDDNPPLILIGHENAPQTNKSVLVNLTDTIPSFYSQFNHIIEIVFSDPSVQQLARDRFRQYREFGCELNTHKM
jgi:DNA polymerase-3 subunit chi